MSSLLQVMPLVTLALTIIYILTITHQASPSTAISWKLPTIISILFLIYTIHTITIESLSYLWTNVITYSHWGNQIWFDLLLALCVGWTLIVPRCHDSGMSRMEMGIWFVLVLAGGSIGMLGFLARVLFLEEEEKNRRVGDTTGPLM